MSKVFGIGAGLALALFGAGAVLAAPSGWFALDGGIRSSGAAHDWANTGSGAASCPAGAVDVPGSLGLFNCGTPGTAGGPPGAPSLTPAAAADPSLISAQFIADPISTDTTACGLGDPTVIAGGGKNGDPIDSYKLTTQSVPDKDDLGNVYAASHTRADNGRPELYFGAERLVNNGDSHIDFEFLQSRVTITSACSGAFAGSRTEGDLLAAVDFTGGGATAGISLWQWHCLPEPGPQPPDGTVCDPAGSTPPQHYQQIGTSSVITFLVNPADVACGGWVCRDKVSGTSTTIAARDFLEGGIDLHALPFTGCFNTFLPHTRTAQSFTAGLKDFTGPSPLTTCRVPADASTAVGSTGGVATGSSVTDTDAISSPAGFTPTGTVAFFLCDPSAVSPGGCPAGGVQVGGSKTLVNGVAVSDPAVAGAAGRYCWRSVYTPDANSQGVYLAATETSATSECFSAAAPVVAVAPTPAPGPALPDTGVGPPGDDPGRSWLELVAGAGAVGGLFQLLFGARRPR